MLTTVPDLELAGRLRLSVTRLARRLRQESAEGLTPSQTSALATLDRCGPLSPSELAAAERIQRPTATRVIAGLEQAGLAERIADPEDRRSTSVKLTPQGRKMLARLRSRKNAYLAQRLAVMRPDELATLERAAELIERLIEDPEASAEAPATAPEEGTRR
jgi:DNA-binding MarR family transcriptional regulator